MRSLLALASLAALLPAAVLAQPKAGAAPAATKTAAAAKPVAYDTALLMRADSGRILGSDKAKLWIVIFSDFQCPYCKAWHDQVDDVLRRD
ncbi:MAG: thioredoxin domain-containing protein [Gemmatimonadetes bacterium]|nr:thioredoxin domain-containing protein [Gemmatimonadota bacterium]